ncbi:hypothetical protein ABID29_000814 [Streptococcus rupicaprae]|uniref:Peptidase C39-like domain-containing protein n=1 Tax=Streptococcus rupicaprae TaxID=759619 RepID=A0ABV2FGN2_9STRE
MGKRIGLALIGLMGILTCVVLVIRWNQSSLGENRDQTSSVYMTKDQRSEAEKATSPGATVKGNESVSTADKVVENPPIPDEVAEKLLINPDKPAEGSPDTALVSGTKHPSGGTRHLLEVTQQVQRAWNTCAPTAVSMMLSSRGISVSQEQLASEMGTDEDFGTHNADAIRILNKHLFGYETPTGNQAGYRLATVTDASSQSQDMKLFKERLVQNIKDGYPMYYTIDNSVMYPGKSGEHNLIGIGYVATPDGKDVSHIYYIDPSYTAQDPTYGGLKIVTPEELLRAMVPCVEPNYGW